MWRDGSNPELNAEPLVAKINELAFDLSLPTYERLKPFVGRPSGVDREFPVVGDKTVGVSPRAGSLSHLLSLEPSHERLLGLVASTVEGLVRIDVDQLGALSASIGQDVDARRLGRVGPLPTSIGDCDQAGRQPDP